MGARFLVLALVCAGLFGQEAKPLIDNERVTVWDVMPAKGETHPPREQDSVVLWIAGERARTAAFVPKGKEGPKGAGRLLVIELKDHPVAAIENKSGYPLAFPRPHVKKLLENERVIAWSYRWNPGEPTPVHFHDKDVVVVYLEDTALTSTTTDGKKTLNDYKAFDVRFNKRDRVHTELLEHGTGSAMMVELK